MLQTHDVIVKMIYDIEHEIWNKKTEKLILSKECKKNKRSPLFKKFSFFLKHF
jgi:hypothetical protein